MCGCLCYRGKWQVGDNLGLALFSDLSQHIFHFFTLWKLSVSPLLSPLGGHVLGVFVCLLVYFHTKSKSIEQIFLNFSMWVGPNQRKKRCSFRKIPDYIRDTKKEITNFRRSHFPCIFNGFGSLVDIASKVMSGSSYNFVCGKGMAKERSAYTFGRKYPD